MDPETVNVLRDYVHELMRCVSLIMTICAPSFYASIFIACISFMVRDRDRIFQREYETASSQYQHISRT